MPFLVVLALALAQAQLPPLETADQQACSRAIYNIEMAGRVIMTAGPFGDEPSRLMAYERVAAVRAQKACRTDARLAEVSPVRLRSVVSSVVAGGPATCFVLEERSRDLLRQADQITSRPLYPGRLAQAADLLAAARQIGEDHAAACPLATRKIAEAFGVDTAPPGLEDRWLTAPSDGAPLTAVAAGEARFSAAVLADRQTNPQIAALKRGIDGFIEDLSRPARAATACREATFRLQSLERNYSYDPPLILEQKAKVTAACPQGAATPVEVRAAR